MMPFYLRQSYDTCLSILESGEPKSSFIGRQVMTVLPGWGSLEVADLDEEGGGGLGGGGGGGGKRREGHNDDGSTMTKTRLPSLQTR
jgi:hypothetical protein